MGVEMEKIIDDVKKVVDGLQRYREATLETKFTEEQKNLINSYPTDETFKVKMFRTIGYGKCKTCKGDTEYQQKTNFKVYCSYNCEHAVRKNNRISEYNDLLESVSLTCLDAENYEHIKSELTFKCKNDHTFTSSFFNIRHIHQENACPECRSNKRQEQSSIRQQEKDKNLQEYRQQNKILAEQRRLERKDEQIERIMDRVGTLSDKKCSFCSKLVPFRLMESNGKRNRLGLYAPSWCDDKCKEDQRISKQLKSLEILKKRLEERNPGVSMPSEWKVDSLMQTFKYECGHEYEANYKNVINIGGQSGKCPSCSKWFESGPAETVRKWIIEAGISESNISINDRKILGNRKEIDIFIPSHNVGFEIDGIWWHSSRYKDHKYHLSKTEYANTVGVKLFHIFTDEMNFKKDIVRSKVMSILGIFKRKIWARKCQVRELPLTVKDEFLNENHLQGTVGSKLNLGLFYENELVSIMTFGRPRDPRLKKRYQWELIRFCSAKDVLVVGAASKLLSHFERTQNPQTLMSYADRRWSVGDIYHTLGFNIDSISQPNYTYVGTGQDIRYSRDKFTKEKIIEQLKNSDLEFDATMTEQQLMALHFNMYQIYDCGQIRFLKEYK